jgi:hypothetical protein
MYLTAGRFSVGAHQWPEIPAVVQKYLRIRQMCGLPSDLIDPASIFLKDGVLGCNGGAEAILGIVPTGQGCGGMVGPCCRVKCSPPTFIIIIKICTFCFNMV